MPLSRLGLHELEPPPDHLLTQLNPQVYVTVQQCNVADNQWKGMERARYLKRLLPNTKIGVRWYCGDHGDDKQSTRISPAQYANDYFQLHVPGTLLMPDNEAEASKDDPDVVRRVVAWWVDVIRRATDAGVTLGIGCFPTGNPDYPQYDLLLPMFLAMRDAAIRGVVHWWRPNAYFVPSDLNHKHDHTERHQREGRRVCNAARIPFPPFFLGELSPLGKITDAHFGFRKMGLNGGQAAQLCIDERLDAPAAFYAAGKGVAGTGSDTWRFFDALRNVDGSDELSWFTVAIPRAVRVPDNANRELETRYIQEAVKSMGVQVDYGTKQPQGRVTLKNASGVRFREAPVNGAIIDTFKGGEVVAFWDKVGSDGWRKIDWNGRIGYASAQYLDVTAVAPAPPPVIPEFPDTPEAAKNLITIAKQLEVAGQATYQAAAELRGWIEWWLARNGVDIAA
jgi:hypothetical protein